MLLIIMSQLELKSSESVSSFISLQAGIVMACWVAVMLAVLIDFWSGTSTAKALGEPLLSKGFRKTISKFKDYFMVLLFVLLFDAFGLCLTHWYHVPFATIIAAIAIMVIEGKSVVENLRRKRSKAADIPEMVGRIMRAVTKEQGIKIIREISESLTESEKVEVEK